MEIGANYLVVLHLSDVPIPLAVEIDITHVGAEHLGHQCPILADLADEIILGPSLALVWGVDLVPCVYSILIIAEFDLAGDQVDQRSEDRVEELVLVGSIGDLRAITRELNNLAALHLQINRVQMCFGREG